MCGSGINIDTRPFIDLVPWPSKIESVTIDQARPWINNRSQLFEPGETRMRERWMDMISMAENGFDHRWKN